MALDLFRLVNGIDIQSDDLTSNAYILQGTGAPGADGGVQDDAPLGSLYMRTDSTGDELQVYQKWQDTNSTVDWRLLATKNYIDSAVQGISWREPVKVLDTTVYANVAAAEAAANVGDTVDGVTILAGDRILLSGLPAGAKNVYIVSGSSGAWTFTEDGNDETDGDAVLVNQGTHADEQWIYDSTNWIQFGGAGSATELAFIRAFIGKDTAGNVTPDYPSNAIVIDGNSLENEIGRLDHATGNLTFAGADVLTSYSDNLGGAATGTITDNLAAIDATFGDGLIAPLGANYVLTDELVWNAAGTLTITDAFDALNEGIGDRSYTDQNIITNGESIAASLDALDVVIGDIDNSSVWTTGGYLTPTTAAGQDIQQTLDDFNQIIQEIVEDTDEFSGTITAAEGAVTVDTISATEATEVKWLIQVKRTSSGHRVAAEVHALTDGTSVDWNRASILRIPTASNDVGDLNLTVSISGGNIIMQMDPVADITYTVKRISKSYLA